MSVDFGCLSKEEIAVIKHMIDWCKYDVEYFKMFRAPEEKKNIQLLRDKIMTDYFQKFEEVEKERLR